MLRSSARRPAGKLVYFPQRNAEHAAQLDLDRLGAPRRSARKRFLGNIAEIFWPKSGRRGAHLLRNRGIFICQICVTALGVHDAKAVSKGGKVHRELFVRGAAANPENRCK